MNKFISILILSFSLCSCVSTSNIVELNCEEKKVLIGKPSPSMGLKTQSQYIINRKTGVYYEYDEFTEKLKPLTGEGTTEEGWKYIIKSVVVDNKWKKQEIIQELSAKDKYKSYFEVDLNTLRYSEINYYYEYIWELSSHYEGVCSFKKPKTTELLDKK
jgi:hypothetical protein